MARIRFRITHAEMEPDRETLLGRCRRLLDHGPDRIGPHLPAVRRRRRLDAAAVFLDAARARRATRADLPRTLLHLDPAGIYHCYFRRDGRPAGRARPDPLGPADVRSPGGPL